MPFHPARYHGLSCYPKNEKKLPRHEAFAREIYAMPWRSSSSSQLQKDPSIVFLDPENGDKEDLTTLVTGSGAQNGFEAPPICPILIRYRDYAELSSSNCAGARAGIMGQRSMFFCLVAMHEV